MTTSTAIPAQPIRFHHHPLSGHSHRVALMLALLGVPVEPIEVDLQQGAHKAPAFLALNAFGQVPVIEDGEVALADSNAILIYLNARYAPDPARWLPADALGAARVQRWLSVAAGPLASGPAAARVVQVFRTSADDASGMIARSHPLLRVMDDQLASTDFLAGSQATLADIANYAYVAHAPEGNVSLADYPHVRAWLARIEALPGFVPMASSRVGLLA